MPESPTRSRVVSDWCVDLALAYLGGLMIGAPAGLVATWLTHKSLALTVVIVVAMVGVLVARRVRRNASVPR